MDSVTLTLVIKIEPDRKFWHELIGKMSSLGMRHDTDGGWVATFPIGMKSGDFDYIQLRVSEKELIAHLERCSSNSCDAGVNFFGEIHGREADITVVNLVNYRTNKHLSIIVNYYEYSKMDCVFTKNSAEYALYDCMSRATFFESFIIELG